jgi:hypothetical protein
VLFALGCWLVVSSIVLHDTRVTTGVASALISGLALAALAARAAARRRPLTPWPIAMAFGLWLVAAPSVWQFSDGADTYHLSPVEPWGLGVVEPSAAAIARADWSSILAGLLVIVLAGSVLVPAVRRWRRAPVADERDAGHGRAVVGDEQP